MLRLVLHVCVDSNARRYPRGNPSESPPSVSDVVPHTPIYIVDHTKNWVLLAPLATLILSTGKTAEILFFGSPPFFGACKSPSI